MPRQWITPVVGTKNDPVLLPDDRDFLNTVSRLEQHDNVSVLIMGPTGSGKEELAKVLVSRGPRGKESFKAVNCAAMTKTLLVSILFGQEEGSHSTATKTTEGYVESVAGGTILFDEIGDLDTESQAVFLRLLQDGSIQRLGSNKTFQCDVRILAATNRPEELRDDFVERFGERLTLLPLWNRRKDIPLLVAMKCAPFDRFTHVSVACLVQLMNHRWVGNIRELDGCVKRALRTEPAKEERTLAMSMLKVMRNLKIDYGVALLARNMLLRFWQKRMAAGERLTVQHSAQTLNSLHLLFCIWRSSRFLSQDLTPAKHPDSIRLKSLLAELTPVAYDPSLLRRSRSRAVVPVNLVDFIYEFTVRRESAAREDLDTKEQLPLKFVEWLAQQSCDVSESTSTDAEEDAAIISALYEGLKEKKVDKIVLRAFLDGKTYDDIAEENRNREPRIARSTAHSRIQAMCDSNPLIKQVLARFKKQRVRNKREKPRSARSH